MTGGFGNKRGPKSSDDYERDWRAFQFSILAILALVFLLYSCTASNAATFKCRGFSFIYTELECEQPLSPATAGATFCQAARPIYWSANDTRATKEAVDAHNRVWKKLCRKGA